jgi:hypothetical protein
MIVRIYFGTILKQENHVVEYESIVFGKTSLNVLPVLVLHHDYVTSHLITVERRVGSTLVHKPLLL